MTLRERCHGISLGIFAGDLGALARESESARAWGSDIIHFDVMDGVFVPQMIGGPGFVKALAGDSVMDVHLMVQKPAEQVESYVAAGADILTIHAEADDCGGAIRKARQAADDAGRAVLVGVALMPGTTLAEAEDALNLEPDIILVLALDPREKAPADVTAACARIADLRARCPDALIAFDGGVTEDTMPEIAAARPDMVVSGSAVMKAADRQAAFQAMSNQL